MPKEEWGTKRVCPTTGKRFYDLNADPIVSPYTGEQVEVENGKTRMIAADEADAASVKANAANDDDDNVSLDEIADVAAEEDES